MRMPNRATITPGTQECVTIPIEVLKLNFAPINPLKTPNKMAATITAPITELMAAVT